jgi:PAS domain S-box-containing protein
MKINTKLLLAFVIIALIPLGVISILSYVNAKEALTHQVLSHLESVAEIQSNRVESIVEQNLERLNLVSSRTQLRMSLDSFINNPNADDQDKINKILLDARSSVSSFRDISVLTLDGEVVASTDAAKIGGTRLNDEVFIRGQNENTADIFFLDENQSLCVYLSGPLYLESKLLGVVVIESTGDSILSAISDYTGLGTTGETQLAETGENGDAVFITPTRFDQDAALSRTVPKEEVNSPIIQALFKNEKLFTDTVDYRGEPVLAATQYIDKTSWGLVTKIDKAEALAPVTSLQHFSFMIILLALALVMLVALYLARSITRPINRLTKVATKISEGDLSARAETTSRDEIGILAQAWNQMKDSLVNTNSKLEQELAQRKQAEERIAHLNSLLRALRDVNQLITRESDRERLIQQSCEILVRTRGYEKAWILLVDENRNPLSVAGADLEEESPVFMERMKSGNYPDCVKQLWNQEDSLLVYNNPGVQHKGCVLAGRHSDRGVYRYKLEYEGKIYGMLGVTIQSDKVADEEEKGLFLELCGDISFALAAIEGQEERKRAEEQTKQLEEYLQLQVDRMPIGLIVWDTEFRVQSWNPAAERIFGFTAEEALGKHPYDIIVPKEAQPHVDTIWGRLLEGDETAHSTNENITKDGPTILCQWTNTPLRKTDGTVVGVLSMVQDITERRKAEEALRQSEEKLRIMFDSVPEGITISDLNGNIMETNESAVRMHGYGYKKELIGESSFKLIAEKDHSRAMDNLKKTLEKESSGIVEYTFLKRDGSEFPAELSAALLKDSAGNPLGFIAVTRDTTERKNMQEQLILTDRLASIGELASGIAHELNNPLTGVIGLSQLLAQRDVPEDIKEDLNVVYSEAQRAASVVKNLLTFARKHPPAKQLISVNDVISKVLELRAYEEKVSNIQVITHLALDLPQIMADYFQLQQVFLNIVINAEHFMLEAHGKGTLTITTQKVGGVVRAFFADDGPGIPKENLGHIFDPFFTTKEVGKGTGLGLSICHGIVTAHGGQIYAESEPGKEATFIVELPIKQQE